MDKLLEYILAGIFPQDTPTFTKNEDTGLVEYLVTVPKINMGRIIGKNGRIIKSVRNILKIRATLEKIKVNLTLVEA
jgi:predicted RNA-binding protein YlqC (UPF0109 family)